MATHDNDNNSNDALLRVQDLHVEFKTRRGQALVLNGVDFEIRAGETLCVVGESGCGKSMTALALLRLIPSPPGRIREGRVLFQGEDLVQASDARMREVRGNRISMIFQEPMTSLNPVFTVGDQIGESLQLHAGMNAREARQRAIEMLRQVGIPAPERRVDEYPHQLSGGMRQRVMIAMALACRPDILIADEPTTALDVDGAGADLRPAARAAAREGHGHHAHHARHGRGRRDGRPRDGDVRRPRDRTGHHRAGAVAARPPLHARADRLPARARQQRRLGRRRARRPRRDRGRGAVDLGAGTGCAFRERCPRAMARCAAEVPPMFAVHGRGGCGPPTGRIARRGLLAARRGNRRARPAREGGRMTFIGKTDTLLSVDDLKVHFPRSKAGWGRAPEVVKAVDGVSFEVRRGSTLAVVGESGSGKTTTALAVMRLAPFTAGRMRLGDTDLGALKGEALRQARTRMQIIFQDPFSSLNPRERAGAAVRAPLDLMRVGTPAERTRRVAELFEAVGLRPEQQHLFPHQFSGGQRQRINIARALATNPELVVCDEPVSALDIAIRAQILNLLARLQRELGLTYLFISHDMAVVEHICDDIAVMYLGQIVERAPRRGFFARPLHPYSVALMSAVPTVSGGRRRAANRIKLSGDPPSPIDPPAGCRFAGRCPVAEPACAAELPPLREVAPDHWVRCRRVDIVDGLPRPPLSIPETP
jgi:oligopeptide/dipeptide ABC transporter ATP-binding protein